MKRIISLAFSILLSAGFAMSQDADDIKLIITNIADGILKNSTHKIINEETGETFDVATEASGETRDLEIQSAYNTWHYWNGVLNIAFDELAESIDPKYGSFSHKNVRFAFDNYEFFWKDWNGKSRWGYPFAMMFGHTMLDDCGAMGASLIQVYRDDKAADYKEYIDKTADYIMNGQDQLEDGILCRPSPEEMTIWGDDVYMSVPFLARMGDLSGEMKYYDFAVLQVKKFYEYLYDEEDGLSYHCYYDNFKQHGVAYWGRANGWMIMGTVELLKYLPEDHPERSDIIEILERTILGLARHQGPDGMWHQLLDKPDSYKESSCTAMFIYSIALAVNRGWVDDRHAAIAQQGWKGLTTMITADGKVMNICRGLAIHDDLTSYYNHPAPLHDIHGLGAILLAGSEMIKMME